MPNPWVALDARPDLVLHRAHISEPARYYHHERAIVVRKGLLLSEERRHLWHEIVHADRCDRACQSDSRSEGSVEREAVRRAIPTCSLAWAAYQVEAIHEVADLLKLPEEWVRFRWRTAPPWERRLIKEGDPIYGRGQSC